MSTFTLTENQAAVVSAALKLYAGECRGYSLVYEPKDEWKRIERVALDLSADIDMAMGGDS